MALNKHGRSFGIAFFILALLLSSCEKPVSNDPFVRAATLIEKAEKNGDVLALGQAGKSPTVYSPIRLTIRTLWFWRAASN